MDSKLSMTLDSLQRQLLLLNELVARVAALAPPDDQPGAALRNELQQIYFDFTVHIAIIQLLMSRTAQEEQALAELDVFTQTLQAGEQTLEALRAAWFPTASNQTTDDKSSPAFTFPRTEIPQMAQKVEQLGVSVRASLFLSFSPRDIKTDPLPTSESNSSALQEAFSHRPFALTGADISSLVPSLGNPDPKTAMEVISAQVNNCAKEWATKQAATGLAIEPLVFAHSWYGNAWSLLRDVQDQLSSPDSKPTPPKEDVLLLGKALVGARVRQSASHRTSIAFIGSAGCGKSSMINAIVGFPLIRVGSEYCYIGYTTSEPLQSPRRFPVECGIRLVYQNQH